MRDDVSIPMQPRRVGLTRTDARVMTVRGDAESRIIRPNGAAMGEIIEINVHHIEFAPDDDDSRVKDDPSDIADRLETSTEAPSSMLDAILTATVTSSDDIRVIADIDTTTTDDDAISTNSRR